MVTVKAVSVRSLRPFNRFKGGYNPWTLEEHLKSWNTSNGHTKKLILLDEREAPF